MAAPAARDVHRTCKADITWGQRARLWDVEPSKLYEAGVDSKRRRDALQQLKSQRSRVWLALRCAVQDRSGVADGK